MNRSPRLFMLALVFVVAVITWGTGNALAQGPIADHSTAILMPSPPLGLSMFLVPNGMGTPFTNCFGAGGVRVNARITVTLINAMGTPVIGWPADRIRIEQMGSPLVWCADSFYPPPLHAPNLADGPTSTTGQTTFTLSYHGGCWVYSPTYVWVQEATGAWNRIPTPVDVSYNSSDLNCDLKVDLRDLVIFVRDYFGPYHYRSDFNYDQVINLIDVAMFAPTFGKTCP